MESIEKFEGRKRKADGEITNDLLENKNQNTHVKNNKSNKKNKTENEYQKTNNNYNNGGKNFDPKKEFKNEKFEFYYKVRLFLI